MYIFLVYLFCILNGIATKSGDDEYELGPFDKLFIYQNETVFFMSASPCTLEKGVSLTILRIQNEPLFFHYNGTGNFQSLPFEKNNSIGIKLDVHITKNATDTKIRATIVKVNLTTTESLLDAPILDVVWQFEPDKCHNFIEGDKAKKNTGFQPQKACSNTTRHGDFSTLCFIRKSAVYITVMNICDVPYSVKLVSVLPHETSVKITIQTYTAKKDGIIHVAGLANNCGLMLNEFHAHRLDHKKQHVQLNYTCVASNSSPAKVNERLIDDSYYTVYGQMCPPRCKTFNSTRRCVVMMRNVRGVLVNATINVHLNVCSGLKAQVEITIDGFNTHFDATMESAPELPGGDSKGNVFNLNGEKQKNENGGYLSASGGKLTLHIKEGPEMHMFHVIIFRHYPEWTDAIPIVHDDVFIDRKIVCSNHGNNKGKRAGKRGFKSWVIAVVVICSVMIIVGGVLLHRWRSRTNGFSGGLPYHMELDEDFAADDDL